MSELPRDMSRAEWQRSEAMVVYSAFADALYQDGETILPDSDIAMILDGQNPDPTFDIAARVTMTPLQAQAYRIGQSLFMGSGLDHIKSRKDLPLQIRRNIEKYTYEGTLKTTLQEAARTIACFPLNTAFTISSIATEQGAEDYRVNSLGDLAFVLRREDVRSVIDQAAFTVNTFWGSLSTEPRPDMRTRNQGNEGLFIFDEASRTFHIEPYIMRRMRTRLATNNRIGVSGDGMPIERRVSSGCPARHLRPHFTGSEKDQISLRMLTQYFGVPADELLALRERTGIEAGLDFMCETLDRASRLQSQLGSAAMAVGF